MASANGKHWVAAFYFASFADQNLLTCGFKMGLGKIGKGLLGGALALKSPTGGTANYLEQGKSKKLTSSLTSSRSIWTEGSFGDRLRDEDWNPAISQGLTIWPLSRNSPLLPRILSPNALWYPSPQKKKSLLVLSIIKIKIPTPIPSHFAKPASKSRKFKGKQNGKEGSW